MGTFSQAVKAARALYRVGNQIAPAIKQAVQGQFGATSVRNYAPCRYEDPHEAAAKAIQTGRLDKYSYHTWQDLINFFTTVGDEPGALRAVTLAHRDGENPVVGFVYPMPSFTNAPSGLKYSDLSPAEQEASVRFYKTAKAAQAAVDTGQLNEFFPRWDTLKQYFFETEDFRNYSRVKDDHQLTGLSVRYTPKEQINPKEQLESNVVLLRDKFIQDYMKENKTTIQEAIKAYRVSQGYDRMI